MTSNFFYKSLFFLHVLFKKLISTDNKMAPFLTSLPFSVAYFTDIKQAFSTGPYKAPLIISSTLSPSPICHAPLWFLCLQ